MEYMNSSKTDELLWLIKLRNVAMQPFTLGILIGLFVYIITAHSVQMYVVAGTILVLSVFTIGCHHLDDIIREKAVVFKLSNKSK